MSATARETWGTTRWRRRPGSPELRYRRTLYQGVYTDGDEQKPCGDGACFHTKRHAAVRCAEHTARERGKEI